MVPPSHSHYPHDGTDAFTRDRDPSFQAASTNESPQHVIKGMFFINSRRLTHDTVLLELKCLWAGVSVLSVAVC